MWCLLLLLFCILPFVSLRSLPNDENVIEDLSGLIDLGTAMENETTEWWNLEEMGNFLEGDIVLTPRQGKSALGGANTRWIGGIVPYVVGNEFCK